MGKPMDGVRVVDLSQLTSGPLATMMLAEQGADVVKVEPPVIGDLFRLESFSHRLQRAAAQPQPRQARASHRHVDATRVASSSWS